MIKPSGGDETPAAGAVDWERLRRMAREIAARAYAPYSRLRVGAAAVVDDGRLVVGCNVENASFGLTLCAECNLLGALYASGGGRLVAFACVDAAGTPLAPCGRCRQLLYEHGGPDLQVALADGPRLLGDLLPAAFGATALPPPADPGAEPASMGGLANGGGRP
ncbi:cytidine deaminase [Frankia sp. Cr2]|uniref:cytidine deaminase n=1 Tax=Frankia sp. Cr2 TaxID=3073932 RepID=UPI002AD2897A|nr:cytidine deaminase [Frankia sp. Cr2]